MADKKNNPEEEHRTKQGEEPERPRKRRIHWAFPLGVLVAGVGGAAA